MLQSTVLSYMKMKKTLDRKVTLLLSLYRKHDSQSSGKICHYDLVEMPGGLELRIRLNQGYGDTMEVCLPARLLWHRTRTLVTKFSVLYERAREEMRVQAAQANAKPVPKPDS